MKRILAAIVLVAAVLAMTGSLALAFQQQGFATQVSGGGMQTDDGVLDWSVPAAASAYNLNLVYMTADMNVLPSIPSDQIFVKGPFTLRVYDYDSGSLVNTDKPMTLTVHYNPADLGGRSESTLKLTRLVDVLWVDQGSTIDTVNHTVTAQVTGSGDFGLLASNAAPAPAPAAAPTTAPAPAPAPAAAAPAPASSTPAVSTSGSSIISGKVFYDKNGDGVMDADDFPVAGAGLLASSGGWFAFTRTDGNGDYSFSNLGDSSYTVNLVVGPEWAFTTPFAVSGIRVSGQAGSVGTASFGMWLKAQ